jgi:hypothetical protein
MSTAASVAAPSAPAALAVPGGLNSAVVTGATRSTGPTGLTFEYSDAAPVLTAAVRTVQYDPRAHDLVHVDLARFASVVLRRVTVTVLQTRAFGATTTGSGTTTRPLRLGLIPRTLATSVAQADGSVDEAATSALLARIPWQRTALLNTTVGAAVTYVWGDGGMDFPPGIQLDLRAGELRFGYPRVLVASLVQTTGSLDGAVVQVDFACDVSGSGFGR